MQEKITAILTEMSDHLTPAQMKRLQVTLLRHLSENESPKEQQDNQEYLRLFLDAKRIEGCSERTITYYRATIERMLQSITTPIRKITTDEIRKYLVDYQQLNNCSKVTVDNVRRNISSFFGWLEELKMCARRSTNPSPLALPEISTVSPGMNAAASPERRMRTLRPRTGTRGAGFMGSKKSSTSESIVSTRPVATRFCVPRPGNTARLIRSSSPG